MNGRFYLEAVGKPQTQLPGPAPQFTVTVVRQQALGQLGSGLQIPAWPSHQLPQRCPCAPPNVLSFAPTRREGHTVGFPGDVLVQMVLSRDQASTHGLHRSGAGPTPPCSLAHLRAGWAGACGHPLASKSGKGGPRTLVPSSTRGSSGQELRGPGSGPRWDLDMLLGRVGLEPEPVILALGKGC